MGNEPSIATLPESWHTILPIITRESILEYSYHHRHRRSTLSSSRSSSTSSSNSRDIINSRSSNSIDNGGKNDKDGEGGDTDADVNVTGQQKSVYLDDDLFDLDEHVPIALAILTAYPHLKDIRFKLVPGVLKEERYWECIFGILDNHGAGDGGGGEIRGVGVENISEAQDEYYCELEKEAGMISPPLNAQTSSGKSNSLGKIGEKLSVKTPILNLERAYYDDSSKSNANTTSTPQFYLGEIKAQDDRIQQLDRSLREARHQARKLALELHKERSAKQKDEINANAVVDAMASCPRCSVTPYISDATLHKGQWVMHPDCVEFMKLDDHLKQNLRSEKQKRINEVLSQMKFILDTDEMKDSYGRWSCCGSEEYLAKGCASKK